MVVLHATITLAIRRNGAKRPNWDIRYDCYWAT
jgi:hypothetical protein